MNWYAACNTVTYDHFSGTGDRLTPFLIGSIVFTLFVWAGINALANEVRAHSAAARACVALQRRAAPMNMWGAPPLSLRCARRS